MMQRFVLHDLIDVVLTDKGRTIIEVGGEEFAQCMYVLLSVPVDVAGESMDEIIENAPPDAKKHERDGRLIPPETAFLAHCSNLQAWVEHDFDTRMLDSRISFPLLKRLAALGDEKAKRVFQSEIMDRLSSGFVPTIITILNTCLEFIPKDELQRLSTHENVLVRWELSCLRGIPDDIKKILMDDEGVKKCTNARNRETPPEMLVELGRDPDPDVRRLVASNIETPMGLILELMQDENESVRSTADVTQFFKELFG